MGKAGNASSELSTVASAARFTIFVVLALTTLVLGFTGLWAYLPSKPEYGHGVLDVLFYDIQLFFVSAEPVNDGGPFPASLEIARFAGPMVTAYAVIELVAAVFANRRQQLRARLARRHVVVCGSDGDALLLVERLRRNGTTVVLVAPRPDSVAVAACRTTRTPLVIGDPSDPGTLRSAGAAKATSVYAFTRDSVVNTAIAVATRSVRATGPGALTCFAFVRDRELRAALLARGLGSRDDRFRLVLFSVDEIAARALAQVDPLVPYETGTGAVAIIGLDDFGQTLAIELARRWRVRTALGADRLRLALVDRTATAVCAQLRDRFTAIESTCELVPLDIDPIDDPTVASQVGATLPAALDRIYVCVADETAAMRLGLSLLRCLRDRSVRVVVRAGARGAVLHEAFHGVTGRLFDDALGSVQVFGAQDVACHPDAIHEGVSMADIARALHDTYVADAVARGDTVETHPAIRPWEELPEELKESNRAHARHIGTKLDAIGCVAVPSFDRSADFAFRTEPDEIELLSGMEHDRWADERRAGGARYGPRRDHGHHPDLVSWAELPEPAREKDRLLVRAIPRILGAAGYQIVRLPDNRPVSRPRPDRSLVL